MYEVGDAVLCDVLVGIIIQVNNDNLECLCSDGIHHTFNKNNVMLVQSYTGILESFERSILANGNG